MRVRRGLQRLRTYDCQTLLPAPGALNHANEIRRCHQTDLPTHLCDERIADDVFRAEGDFSFRYESPVLIFQEVPVVIFTGFLLAPKFTLEFVLNLVGIERRHGLFC